MAADFFSKKSPATRFLTSLCNLIMVNLIFIVTCIPIFTIGASLCGLYTITFEILNNEEVLLIKEYFRAFKECFVRATLLWVPILLIDTFLAWEVLLVLSGLEGTTGIMLIPIILVMIVSLFIIVYAFPLLARFENTLKQTLKNSFLMGLGNLPTTIMIIVVHLAIILILLSEHYFLAAVIIMGLLFIGFALIALLNTFFIDHVLPKSSKMLEGDMIPRIILDTDEVDDDDENDDDDNEDDEDDEDEDSEESND